MLIQLLAAKPNKSIILREPLCCAMDISMQMQKKRKQYTAGAMNLMLRMLTYTSVQDFLVCTSAVVCIMCMLFVCMYHVGAGRGCRLDRSCKSCARAAVVLVVNVVVFIDTRIKRRCGSRLNVSLSYVSPFFYVSPGS